MLQLTIKRYNILLSAAGIVKFTTNFGWRESVEASNENSKVEMAKRTYGYEHRTTVSPCRWSVLDGGEANFNGCFSSAAPYLRKTSTNIRPKDNQSKEPFRTINY